MTPDAHGYFAGKRLVVLGAGYVGGELARQGAERGLTVFALTRNPERIARLRAWGINGVQADLASHDWHDQMPADAEFVANCVSSGGGGMAGYRHSYVEGTRSILHWGQSASNPGTLVYTSSTSVYPQGGGVRVTESHETHAGEGTPGILAEAEALAATWRGRAFVLRLAGIYGPGRHHLLDQLRAGESLLAGRGEHHLNLVHRDDCVDAIWAALAAPPEVEPGVFNVADDHPAPKAELATWLAMRLGRAEPSFSGAITGGRRAITPDRIIANDRIKQALGWAPRYPGFRQGYAAILKDLGL